MTDATTNAERYIATWNERDAERRLALIAASWTETATYVDPLMRDEGHEQINSLVEAVQSRFPGFRFNLIGVADGYDDNLRFSWGLGPDSGDAIIKGTDFALLDGGRLKAVHGFLDLVPDA
ncbi:nuclear transport factor 2 family protein [Rhizobium sp. Root1220]|uniref:nuclear transport factor 2 family protein n=1 Tax=Rhizobium sp. Root1220 TaxID=1736432 RepID=UPI0006F357A3|nr:nuclear transport factor 2 family protein [Rhizobium sp. Root1220]KQV81785.1 polyketide cyclase [Rhizobium sp. Root1220]